MATSTTKLARDALVAWAAAIPLGLSATVSAAPPEPGTKEALPTLACWFPTETTGKFEPVRTVVDGVTHLKLGECEASVAFRWRLASSDDAEKVHALFRFEALNDASDYGMSIPITFAVGSASYSGALYLTGERSYADPEQTELRDLWVVEHRAMLTYPDVYVDADTDLMAIAVAVTVGTTETSYLSSGADPIGATWDD